MKKIAKSNMITGGIVFLLSLILISSCLSAASIEKTRKEIITHQPTNMGTYFEGFESYGDFILDFPPWTQVDYDEGPTWGMEGIEWENVGYTGSFMIFNPYQTTPPVTDDDECMPHSGNKYAACWDAITDYAPNDDWLISPQLPLEAGAQLTFWGKSINDQYGLEEIEVGVSTTDADPDSFTIISGNDFIQVPPTWTEYSFDLSDYAGNDVYISIHVVSWDVFAFFLDDFEVTGVFLPIPDLECEGSLSIEKTKAGEEASVGSFTVKNVGETGSQLSWQIADIPTWGINWTFTPAGGSGLETSVTQNVQVSVIAPDEKNQEFSGEIKVVNSADPNDFEIIQVTLSTPKSKFVQLQKIIENHPILSNLLQQIFGLN